MFNLSTLAPLKKKRKRIGRGGSRGGTSGRGHKGQKARTGGVSKVRAVFEGGQSPLTRRLPKRGFNNALFAIKYEIVNLDTLEQRFENNAVITINEMIEQGLIKTKDRIKVLGRGTLAKKLTVHADAFSQSARNSIEAQGGKALLNKETT